jgi:hypothetical protein
MINIKNIPQELKTLPQWVCWKTETRDGKETKIPKNPISGINAASDNPGTWASFDRAIISSNRFQFDGVGFMMSESDPYCGVDLDRCREPETGKIEPWAMEIINRLNSYTEISPNGRGVHIWVKGKLPPGSRRKGQIEMYDDKRYFTLTGDHLEGTPTTIEGRDAELKAIHRRIFGVQTKGRSSANEPTATLFRDGLLIRTLIKSANGEKFEQLFYGNWQGYRSPSEADLALCGYLAAATGNDSNRIDRIFRISMLMREKWDEARGEKTYGEITIGKAIANSPEPAPGKAFAGKNPPKITLISAAELQKKDFPPLRWAVPNFLPEGLTILASRPKIGKSWLALYIGIGVATGGEVFGKKLEQGSALYLGLEDPERRLKERLEMIMEGANFPQDLEYNTVFPRMDQGGLEALEDLLNKNPKLRFVCIDTLARITPQEKSKQTQYESDYRLGIMLQDLAKRNRIALMVVHHTRKMPADDYLDTVSGSTGLTGAADCIMVFTRLRNKTDAVLKITGRDVEETELALQFNKVNGIWEYLGEASEFTLSQERQDIINLLKESVPLGAKEISEVLKKSYDNTRQLLWKMANEGLIKKIDKKYTSII